MTPEEIRTESLNAAVIVAAAAIRAGDVMNEEHVLQIAGRFERYISGGRK